MFRRTKIIATIGPACDSEQQIDRMLALGVDVFRLNFSHGDHANKAAIIQRIRTLSKHHRRAVAILGDLQGPKIRTGRMKGGAIEQVPGSEIQFTTRDILGDGTTIPTSYKQLTRDVSTGDRILLDDGLMELEVLATNNDAVTCRVVHGGILKDRKGINLPGVDVSAPAMTEKDCDDLNFCIQKKIDYVALSFVRKAADVENLRNILTQRKADLRIIAKIEKPEAVDSFDAILAAADGIMVARGDLGVEIRPEKVPLIQKQIIRKCNEAGKPVITATQMLESMVNNPRPTRAETSDVANAILDSTDAVMLSGETASGSYPLEAIEVMTHVARDVEGDPQLKEKVFHPISGFQDQPCVTEAIGRGACRIAEIVGANAILAFTQTGNTAALVSKYRPNLPIYAVTPSQAVRRRLALFSGVRSVRVDIEGDTETQIYSVVKAVLNMQVLKPGDLAVITMGSPLSDPGTTNLLKIHRLEADGPSPGRQARMISPLVS